MPPASLSVLPWSRALPGFQLGSSSPPLRPAAHGDGSIARGCLCPLRSAPWDGVCVRGGRRGGRAASMKRRQLFQEAAKSPPSYVNKDDSS